MSSKSQLTERVDKKNTGVINLIFCTFFNSNTQNSTNMEIDFGPELKAHWSTDFLYRHMMTIGMFMQVPISPIMSERLGTTLSGLFNA